MNCSSWKEARLAHKLSLRQLAKLVNIDHRVLKAHEEGRETRNKLHIEARLTAFYGGREPIRTRVEMPPDIPINDKLLLILRQIMDLASIASSLIQGETGDDKV